MKIIAFQGEAAFTPFRLRQKGIAELRAQFSYFVQVDERWQESQSPALAALLAAKLQAFPPAENLFWVVARVGTIAPWTSKATEIIQNCGFSGVRQVVRAIGYQADHVINLKSMAHVLYDPLTESLLTSDQLMQLFLTHEPQALTTIDVLKKGRSALVDANHQIGLALNDAEIDYLLKCFQRLKRNPTDAELMMFAQVNSEHCRHKIFNATWVIDDQPQDNSLFNMIRSTYHAHPEQVLVAYADNAAVLKGYTACRWLVDPQTNQYREVSSRCILF